MAHDDALALDLDADCDVVSVNPLGRDIVHGAFFSGEALAQHLAPIAHCLAIMARSSRWNG